MKHPVRNFGLISICLALAVAAVLKLYVNIPDPILCWIIAITSVTFLIYFYDKTISGKKMTRTPEIVLLSLALVGGAVGALAGMRLFRHKTLKKSFQFKFWLIVIFQVAAVASYFLYFKKYLFS